MPPNVKVASDIGLTRFHGRNAEMWEKSGASVAERFNYLHTEDEVREWAPRIRKLASETGQLHVQQLRSYFNLSK